MEKTMDQTKGDDLLKHLIELTREVSNGQYDNVGEVFEYTKAGQYPKVVEDLAESFGMMIVKIEGREYQLEQTIEDLKRKKKELEDTLSRVEILENIKGLLGRFVPESVKRIIEKTPDSPDLEKREVDVSVLFLDIAGYTRMSESVEFDKMNYLVETYFSSFLDDIYLNKGDINETAGDGLMIIFQDEDQNQHAYNAVKTALAIDGKVGDINRELADKFEPIVVNIGINSGLALVGSSRFEGLAGTRWTYTASGPVTNVAARIGQLAKGGEILIGNETALRIKGGLPMADFGAHKLKNVSELEHIFKVLT